MLGVWRECGIGSVMVMVVVVDAEGDGDGDGDIHANKQCYCSWSRFINR